MATYGQATQTVRAMLNEILDQHYPDLRHAKVTFDLLFAYPTGDGAERKPPLMVAGYPAIATVRITPLRDRVLKVADALICIDKDEWENLTDPQRRAVLDHEAHHVEIQWEQEPTDKDYTKAVWKTDDHGRPKLKMKPHDFQIGGFAEICQRYGKDAVERISLERAAARYAAETE